jgi:hypothetical protein
LPDSLISDTKVYCGIAPYDIAIVRKVEVALPADDL